MKAALKSRSPAELVKIVDKTAPEQPPARVGAEDKAQPYSTKLRMSTLAALDARARADGVSVKAVICRALAKSGIKVAPADLEDRTPRRRGLPPVA